MCYRVSSSLGSDMDTEATGLVATHEDEVDEPDAPRKIASVFAVMVLLTCAIVGCAGP